jgi:hypothetical protein
MSERPFGQHFPPRYVILRGVADNLNWSRDGLVGQRYVSVSNFSPLTDGRWFTKAAFFSPAETKGVETNDLAL